MKLSIIIPTYNEEAYIEECLKSLEVQTYDLNLFEVIIVDGGSTDNTLKKIIRFKEKSKLNILIKENKNKTAPYAMNIGIKAAKGEIIIRIDGHAYVEKEFLEKCVDTLKRNSDVCCVGGRIETISKNDIGEVISLAMSSPFGVGDAKFRYSNEETYVDTLAFGAYKKNIFDEIGLFDEEFVRNQDDELNYRVIKSGNKILLNPDIKSYYYSRNSLKKLYNQYFQYGYWKIKVIKKHKNISSLRQLIPAIFILSITSFFLLSFLNNLFTYILMFELILYGIFSLIFSVKKLKFMKKKSYLLKMPIIFCILHVSYGVGYIFGIFDFILLNKNGCFYKVNR